MQKSRKYGRKQQIMRVRKQIIQNNLDAIKFNENGGFEHE